jgi:hypothetical protein
LTLAAIVLPVAMRAVSTATLAAGEARRQREAATLAEATLADLIATEEWQGSDLSGDCGDEWPAYRWTADVEAWEGTTLWLVTVEVNWHSAGKERRVTLSTLAYSGRQ